MPGNRVSILTLIPLLSEDTGRNDLMDKIDLIAEYALEAERKIGTRKWLDSVKPTSPDGLPVAKITIQNYRGVLPPDFYDCDRISACSTQGICSCFNDPCTCTCSCGIDCGSVFSSTCNCGFWNYYMPKQEEFRIEGCYIVAPFRVGAITMPYFAIPLDDQGYPLIKLSHRDAIQAFCFWTLNKANWITGKIDSQRYQMMELRWKDLCSQCRGNDNLPDRNQMADAAQTTNDPYKMKRGVYGYGGNGWGGWGGF